MVSFNSSQVNKNSTSHQQTTIWQKHWIFMSLKINSILHSTVESVIWNCIFARELMMSNTQLILNHQSHPPLLFHHHQNLNQNQLALKEIHKLQMQLSISPLLLILKLDRTMLKISEISVMDIGWDIWPHSQFTWCKERTNLGTSFPDWPETILMTMSELEIECCAYG